MREHLEVDEPRGENAALAVNSRVRGATLPEELLRIGDRAVPHPQILACAQLVADEQPAVYIAGDRAARRGSLRGVRLSAVLHAKERVHDDQKILTERKYFFGVSASFPVSKFEHVSQFRRTKANTCGASFEARGFFLENLGIFRRLRRRIFLFLEKACGIAKEDPCDLRFRLQTMHSAEGSGAFDDQFELRTKLGDGMTASVYVAVHRQSGQLLACKLCDRHKSKG